MFRRKTDQVYATLQQVQRRITEQSGVQPPEPAPKPAAQPSPSLYPFNQPVNTPFSDAAEKEEAKAPGKRSVLQLSPELASTLAVLWLITVVMAFVLGRAQGHKNQEDPGAGYAVGAAGNRESAAVASAKPVIPVSGDAQFATPGRGNHVLILASATRADNETEERFSDNAKSLNEMAAKGVDKGYRPWFGVRHPSSGGLQLVFGCLNGQFGVDKTQFDNLADEMRDKAKFKDPHWMSLSEK